MIGNRHKVFVAGHRGLAGSAVTRALEARGYPNLLLRTHEELDLTDQRATRDFLATERPAAVVLCAAKVGGILANHTYPAEFVYQNLAIETNVIHAAYQAGVQRLLFLGSSCIYPRDCPQPMAETALLTGPLELTNRPYAVAKIAGIELCWAYNRQYGTRYVAAMPTNLYGPGDTFHLQNSHVLPALLRKMHEAKAAGASEVMVWGTGTPLREFLYSEDMAEACVFLLEMSDAQLDPIVRAPNEPPLVNIGSGVEVSIAELARLVARVVGFEGELRFDRTRPDGTPRKLMDSSRLRALGWRPQVPLEEGVARAYQAFLAQSDPSATEKKPPRG